MSPFIDEYGLMRVGGRLVNSLLSYNQKHPILLPNCEFARLFIVHTHQRNFHVGPQALLSYTRHTYWIIRAKSICKKIFRDCLRCFRLKPVADQQIMGQLPKERVQQFRPFLNIGIDFGGPFLIKRTSRSNVKSKCYLSLFICFATKAVHLELVSDLSSAAFLLAFRRFTSRRGRCNRVYTDNGTNFDDLQRFFNSEINRHELAKYFSEEGIQWETIPPRTPHFGGLWEAGIKMAKRHLKAIVGNSYCTYEECKHSLLKLNLF